MCSSRAFTKSAGNSSSGTSKCFQPVAVRSAVCAYCSSACRRWRMLVLRRLVHVHMVQQQVLVRGRDEGRGAVVRPRPIHLDAAISARFLAMHGLDGRGACKKTQLISGTGNSKNATEVPMSKCDPCRSDAFSACGQAKQSTRKGQTQR